MHYFISTWSKSVAFILIATYVVPDFYVENAITALEEAAAFGFILAALKPFFEWVELPVNRYTLALFGVIVNIGFIFWTCAVIPGFGVGNKLSALALIALLTVLNTRSLLRLGLVPEALKKSIIRIPEASKRAFVYLPQYFEKTLIYSKTVAYGALVAFKIAFNSALNSTFNIASKSLNRTFSYLNLERVGYRKQLAHNAFSK